MKSVVLIFVLLTIISINGNCIQEEKSSETQKSSFSELLGDIKCGFKVGAKKTGEAIRSSYSYVKNKLTPTKNEDKIDVRSSAFNDIPESKLEVTTVKMVVDDRSLFEAPCQGFVDRNGVCRKSD